MRPRSFVDEMLRNAFEHFEGDSDIGFAREAARLLKKGGRLCIVPLFVTTEYVELYKEESTLFDKTTRYLFDPKTTTATPFARMYEIKALERRLLGIFPESEFKTSLYGFSIDGREAPTWT